MAKIDAIELKYKLDKNLIDFAEHFPKNYPSISEYVNTIDLFNETIKFVSEIIFIETSDFNRKTIDGALNEIYKNILSIIKVNDDFGADPYILLKNINSALEYIKYIFANYYNSMKSVENVNFKKLTGNNRLENNLDNEIDENIKRISGSVSRIENSDKILSALQGAMDRVGADIQRVRDERAIEAAEHSERLATVEDLIKTLHGHEETAQAVLKNAEEAFATATRQGLAKAFSDQEKKQSEALRTWIAVLLGALIVGGALGAFHFQEVREILGNKDLSDLRVVLYLLVSALFLAGPVWFAWLATKQIGQRFRLAQDYAFKAAVASAYLGYREEVKQIDQVAQNNALEQRLMASVLSRFDEQPLRLIDDAAHGSPAAEVLEKFLGATGKAADTVSEAAGKVTSTVGKAVDVVKDAKTKSGDAGAGDKP